MSNTEKQLTPMQELIDQIDTVIDSNRQSFSTQLSVKYIQGLEMAKDIAQSLLPKEKQMVEDFISTCDADSAWWYADRWESYYKERFLAS